MSKYNDDRKQSNVHSYPVLVGGIDTFMSGWGEAEGGKSYAFWACTPASEQYVTDWVKGRDDFEHVVSIQHTDLTQAPVRMQPNDHCHVYVVHKGHRALDEEKD